MASARTASAHQAASTHRSLHPLPQATRIVMTQIVSPAESSGMDICSGGTVLSWIDICAGLAAKTLARGPAVTASVDAVHFLRPCHVRALMPMTCAALDAVLGQRVRCNVVLSCAVCVDGAGGGVECYGLAQAAHC